jgi:3-methyladenine DNA glycosylase AlkC
VFFQDVLSEDCVREATADAKENSNAFKHLFDAKLLKKIALEIAVHDKRFDADAFQSIKKELPPLEMKARVQLIRDALKIHLPEDYPQAVAVILKVLKSGELSGFSVWPFAEYIQTYGVDTPDVSLKALKTLTVYFTAEWAVRPFIVRDEDAAMAFLLDCTQDKNEHVRRWASEGSRSRLPWGQRLNSFIADPAPVLPILDALKCDDALYVRKSVSNHINDISKDHPDVALQLLARWQNEVSDADLPKINWIIARALRTLIKAGHPEALALIGVKKAAVEVGDVQIVKKTIRLGEYLDFAVTIRSTSSKPQKLVVDYIVHFMKSNGRTAPKVFKLKTITLPAKGEVTITKSHPVKYITTRDYYAGEQGIQVQVNGVAGQQEAWQLKLS